MFCERANALNFVRNSGRRIGFRLDLLLGHCDPVTEIKAFRFFVEAVHQPFWGGSDCAAMAFTGMADAN